MVFKKRTEEKLGEILIRQGAISEKQLEEALGKQRSEGGLLGEIMIRLGFVNERVIAQAITSQYGFPFLPLESYDVNAEAVKLVPEKIALKHHIMPVDIIGDVVTIAMSNPLNRDAIEEVERATGKTVRVFISLSTSIKAALSKIYGESA